MEKIEKLGLGAKLVKGLSRSNRALASLEAVIDASGADLDNISKTEGVLLYHVGMHYKTEEMGAFSHHRDILARYIGEGSISRQVQLDEAFSFLDAVKVQDIDENEFKRACGVSVTVSDEDISREVSAYVESNKKEIMEQRYLFELKFAIRELNKGILKWAHGRKVKDEVDKQILELLGPKTEADEQARLNRRKKGASKGKSEEKKAGGAEEKVNNQTGGAAEDDISKFDDGKEHLGPPLSLPAENTQNTAEVLAAHLKRTEGKVVTRFPPEPNGYLHIGHAKAMAMDFGTARRMEGECILRYDDTNPEAEKKEYIESIKDTVEWLGHSPVRITYSSDYFDQLYEFAVQLIKEGKAYVCHQTGDEISHGRENRLESPWRNRPVEESLKLFEDMKKGKFEEGAATLRCKMDMKSDNPCMRDFVAYRVKYVPHPKAGDKWCIYPSYDYTHCIIDSLEDITHSLCTLEFRVRRESYMWLLNALGLYKPIVFEFARLNLSHTVMSKRKLQELVTSGAARGWDDPRMPTINGMRRRGVSPAAINRFVTLAGVSLTENLISHKLLESCVRRDLDVHSPRRMAVVAPLKVTISNLSEPIDCEIPNHPKNAEMGTRTVTLFKTLWIEQEDFREEAPRTYFGLTRTQSVSLKYVGRTLTVKEVVKGDDGVVESLVCNLEEARKTKGYIHWVSCDANCKPLGVVFRLYDHLFNSENPLQTEDWHTDLNPDSLIVKHGYGEEAIRGLVKKPFAGCQIERTGFFAVDGDSSEGEEGEVVLNLTISLREKQKKK